LEDFAKWILAKEGLFSPRYVKRIHLIDYLAAQKERGLAPSSMKGVVVALKIFFRFLKVRGLVQPRSRRAHPASKASGASSENTQQA